MSHWPLAAGIVGAVYVLLFALRIVLVLRAFGVDRRHQRRADDEVDTDTPPMAPYQSGHAPAESRVSVLQAILSGDPTLERNLDENLCHHPAAHFVWLVDDDDTVAQELCARLVDAHASRVGPVDIVRTQAAPQGVGPKVHKLVVGLPHAARRGTDLVAVLDDDTVLPRGALERAARALDPDSVAGSGQAVARGDLVTGLPRYRVEGSLWSRLVAAFVNANALLTYLPILAIREPVTINGMFYVTPRATLASVGGFEAIQDRLCDDFEIARLYLAADLHIVQSTIVHPISTTVRGPGEYFRILRRWMVFANHLFQHALDPAILVLVVLPALLPLALVVLAAVAGPSFLVLALAVLLAKAIVMATVRHSLLRTRESPSAVLLEVVADLLQPVHALTALIQPRTIRWRDKSIVTVEGGVRYR